MHRVVRFALAAVTTAALLARSSAAFGVDCNRNGRDDALDLQPILVTARAIDHYPVDLRPRAIVAAKLSGRDGAADGDAGRLDLAVASRHSQSITILRGLEHGRFEPARVIHATHPAWLVGGDFNGDARVDLITFSSLGSEGVLLLQPIRGFTDAGATVRERSFDLGFHAHDAAVTGDLDGDGSLDLVLRNPFLGRMTILYGTGPGEFSAPVALDLPADAGTPGPFELAASSDFERLDLFVILRSGFENGAAGESGLWRVPHLGERAFGNPEVLPTPGDAERFATGDFDGDGRRDIATVERTASPGDPRGSQLRARIAFANGRSSSLKLAPTADASQELRVLAFGSTDVDDDADLDLYASTSDGRLVVLVSDGEGQLEIAPHELTPTRESAARHVVAADFDRDGRVELAAASRADDDTNNEVTLFEFELAPSSLDRNGDRVPDECSTDCDAPTVPGEASADCDEDGLSNACELVTPSTAFVETQELFARGRDLAAADFDEDGRVDLLVGGDLRRGNGDGTFDTVLLRDIPGSPVSADIDGDGHVDFATVAEPATISVYYGRGDATFDRVELAIPEDETIFDMAWLDVDGDDRSDLVYSATTPRTPDGQPSRMVAWLQSERREFTRGSDRTWLTANSLDELVVADFDGDGRDDVVANWIRRESELTLLFGDGVDPLRRSVSIKGSRGARLARAADFDLDGDIDLAVISRHHGRDETGSHLTVLFNSGSGFFQPGPTTEAPAWVSDFQVGDIDGDRFPDLVTVTTHFHAEESFVEQRLHPGDRARLPGLVSFTREDISHSRVYMVDLNNDDRRDVILRSSTGDGYRFVPRVSEDRPRSDCNSNGVPDACDVFIDPTSDCDGNGQLDECEEGSPSVPCGEPPYDSVISGPEFVRASVPGKPASKEYLVELVPHSSIQGERRGADGWSLSIAADGCTIVDATTSGTMAADVDEDPPGLRNGGFERTELARDNLYTGAVSAVVLAIGQPITLPTAQPSAVLRLTVELEPSSDDRLRRAFLFHHDHLTGDGHPVTNLLFRRGQRHRLTLDRISITVESGPEWFRRGDANDDGRVDISDSIFVLNHLFLGGETPPCRDAADADDNGALELTDGVFINSFLFLGGNAPPAPGVAVCAEDPTEDALGCRPLAPCF